MDSTTVDFGADDVRPAIDLLTRFATPGSEIASWVHVEPVGVPDQALPEVSGFLGRRKRAAPPSVQVVYVDPARGPGESVVNLDAPGLVAADVPGAAGIAIPAGCTVDASKSHMMVTGDVDADPGRLMEFGVACMRAALGGWAGTFRATGVHA